MLGRLYEFIIQIPVAHLTKHLESLTEPGKKLPYNNNYSYSNSRSFHHSFVMIAP